MQKVKHLTGTVYDLVIDQATTISYSYSEVWFYWDINMCMLSTLLFISSNNIHVSYSIHWSKRIHLQQVKYTCLFIRQLSL